MSDPLLRPSLQEKASEADLPGWAAGYKATAKAPWNLSYQFLVAFFGGVVAIGALSWLNAGRLGMSQRSRWWMVGLTLALWALWTWFFFGIWTGSLQLSATGTSKSWARLIGRLTGVALYLVLAAMQKKHDRAWRTFSGREYASLWPAGWAAALLGWVVQLIPFGVLYAVMESR